MKSAGLKIGVILVILVGMAFAAMQIMAQMENDESKFQVAIDEATKQAMEKGEFQFPEEIIPIESKDCEGTQWIKQQECSLNGKPMDGTEGSCGPGKEIWILDPNHKDFKPATGDGKCDHRKRIVVSCVQNLVRVTRGKTRVSVCAKNMIRRVM